MTPVQGRNRMVLVRNVLVLVPGLEQVVVLQRPPRTVSVPVLARARPAWILTVVQLVQLREPRRQPLLQQTDWYIPERRLEPPRTPMRQTAIAMALAEPQLVRRCFRRRRQLRRVQLSLHQMDL